jgi:U32 family peptidase
MRTASIKILAPVNNAKDALAVIRAGADEVYCGLLSPSWSLKFTNVASANRREWKTANVTSCEELAKIVRTCHASGVPVFLTLNALYSQEQYSLIFEQIETAREIGIDAFIIADIGLMMALKNKKIRVPFHVSTGGTTFNSKTAEFYRELGAFRIVLPRHLRVTEIADIVSRCPSMQFEVFILNSGCKNIDGYCTYHHGVNEILYPGVWDFFKKHNFDRHVLNIIKLLPPWLSQKIKGEFFGIDSACLLDYRVDIAAGDNALVAHRLERCFNLLSGVDTCGACRLAEFMDIGVYGVKIVGRNYSTGKKVNDVTFLKNVMSEILIHPAGSRGYRSAVKRMYRKIYKTPCRNLCYYADGM